MRENLKRAKISLCVAGGILVASAAAWGQAKYPDWNYPKTYDSIVAAPDNNRLLFEDNKLRFIEVTIPPSTTEPINGQPYPAVYLYDRPQPDPSLITDTKTDPSSPLNGQGAGHGTPPAGMDGPSCDTMAPLAPHSVANHNGVTIHYWVLEFKRLDGRDLGEHWKEWYPWMPAPIPSIANSDPTKLGPPFSKEWPYPIALDSVSAAPNNHKLLFADASVRLVEVTERAGGQENLHGHPYRSVFINDVTGPGQGPAQGGGAAGATGGGGGGGRGGNATLTPLGKPGLTHQGESGDYQLNPSDQMRRGGTGRPPEGMISPTCSAATPQSPHAHIVGGEVPGHFYRVEFLRADWVTRLPAGN
jgi:hypothetical protein